MLSVINMINLKPLKPPFNWAECVIVANFVMIGQAVAEIGPCRLMVFKMAVVCRFGFSVI